MTIPYPGAVVRLPLTRAELERGRRLGALLRRERGDRSMLDVALAARVAAFAAGSVVAGLVSQRVEGRLGRRLLLWSAAALLAVGTVGLTAAGVVALTVASVGVMGLGGGLVLATVQSALADRHGEQR